MSVTKGIPAGTVGRLFLCLGMTAIVSVTGWAGEAGEGASTCSSLVRVQFKRKVPAVVYQDKLIPEASVLEVSEFPGIVADSRGYVVSYIGSAWADLGSGQPQVDIQLPDGEKAPARFVGIDERVSLAVLHAQQLAKRAVVFGSLEDVKDLNLMMWSESGSAASEMSRSALSTGDARHVSVGKWAAFPLDVLQHSASDFEPERQIRVRLDEDAGKVVGTVGAPLLDDSGRFFGFVTGVEKAGLVQSARLLRVIGVNSTRSSLNDVLARHGSIRAGWLGVWLDDTTDHGRIRKVVKGGPADRAGLEDGDVILKLGDTTVWSATRLVRVLRWESPGTKIQMTIERRGERKTVPVELGSWPVASGSKFAYAIQIPKVWTPNAAGAETPTSKFRVYPVPLDAPVKLGLAVEPLTAQLARYFHVPGGTGLLVTSVVEGSPASRFEFRAGDVLTQINGSDVESPADIRKVIDSSKDGMLVISFVRDGEVHTRKVVLQ
jgi:S1-C subfamily serine protease